MTETDWTEKIKKFEKPTNKMLLQEMENPCHPVSSIGGAPWWPKGTERPKCEKGHFMSFIAQINLSDLPNQNEAMSGLFSFHYCIECQHEGNMAFGWYYEKNKNYDVRVFQYLNVENDGLGIVSGPIIPSRIVKLEKIEEIPNINDLPLNVNEMIPDEFFEFEPPDYDPYKLIPGDTVWPNMKHVHGSKIGGHPTWVQDPKWPTTPDGKRMKFIAQLDGIIGEGASWPNGTAFLFIYESSAGEYIAEMGLQHS